MARLVANVDITTETWGQLIVRTNTLLDALSYEIITANSTWANTGNTSVQRNAQLYGTFIANTVYVSTTLAGGSNTSTKDTLRVSSNVEFGTGSDRFDSRANSQFTNTVFFTANVQANGASFLATPDANTAFLITPGSAILRSNNFILRSNTSFSAFTMVGNGTTTDTTIAGNTLTSSANLIVSALNHTIAGNTNFDSGTMFVDGTNNRVGLGTTTPDSTFKVVGASNTTGNVWIGNTTITVGNVSLSSAIMTLTTNSLNSNVMTIAGANVNVDAGTLFVDQVNTRVGINSTAPNASLAVVGTANVSANVTIDSGTFFLDAVTNKVGFNTLTPDANVSIVGTANVSGNTWIGANTTIAGVNHTIAGNVNFDTATMFVDSVNDRVGFGTNAPNTRLQVNGAANVSGATWIGGNVNFTTGIMTINATGAANTLTVVAANVNIDAGALFVDHINTRVGVNNTAPDATLKVTGTANITANTWIGGTANVVGNVNVQGISHTIAGNSSFDSGVLFVDSVNNRVGMNTTTPDASLNVVGTANVSGNTWIGANTTIAGASHIISGNVNVDSGVLFVDGTNNRVGIGTTTPDAELKIVGSANVSTQVKVGANVWVNTTSFNAGNTVVHSITNSTQYLIRDLEGTEVGNNFSHQVTSTRIRNQKTYTEATVAKLHAAEISRDEFYLVTGQESLNALAFTSKLYANTTYLSTSNSSHTSSLGITGLTIGSNVSVTTSRLTIGTSTVNTFITSTAIETDGTLTAAGNTALGANLSVTGRTDISNTLFAGNTTLTGFINVSSTANVADNLRVGNGATVGNTLVVTGNASLAGALLIVNTNGSANTLTIGAANVSVDSGTLFVDQVNNRVGVNSTAPDAGLAVTGTANITANTWIGGTANVVGNVNIQGISHAIAGNTNFDSGTFFVDSVNNRIGLGTTAPNATIQVVGAANVSSALYVGGNGAIVGNVTISGTVHTIAGNTNFDTNTLMVDSVNDRIGIGTATPDTKLQVVGAANVSSAMYVGGNANFATGILTVNAAAGNANTVTIAGANVSVDSGTLFVDQINNRVGINATAPTSSLYANGTANVTGNTWIGGNTTIAANITVSGTATIGGSVTIESDYFIDVVSNTNIGNTSASRIIYTFPKATYRSGKLMVFANNTNGTANVNQMAEMVVAHDNDLAAYVSVYGVVASPSNGTNTAAPLGTFSAQINSTSNNVEILMNQIYSNSAVKVVAHLIK